MGMDLDVDMDEGMVREYGTWNMEYLSHFGHIV